MVYHSPFELRDQDGGIIALAQFPVDGPRSLHDVFRVDRQGRGTFDAVMRGLDLLQEHGVDFNILCSVHAANADHPLTVYRFFRDEAGARFIQMIPIVEQNRDAATGWSVGPAQWGRFLCTIFDEWIRRDVGTVFVQQFDTALASWLGHPSAVCVAAPTCGTALVLEHTGDLYSCDHFVEPPYRLGNILQAPMADLVASAAQRRFGRAKQDALPRYCSKCTVRFACHGGCPKDRFFRTPDGEPGLNYLCEGYRAFFTHIDQPMRAMAALLRQGRYADEVMAQVPAAGKRQAKVGRNDPCPCGSGLPYKHCCRRT